MGAEQLATVAVIAEACLSAESKSRQASDGPGTLPEQSLVQLALSGPGPHASADEQCTAAYKCFMQMLPLDPA